MAEFLGPILLDQKTVRSRVPRLAGAFALGYARPQESAVFISFVGRADTNLQAALLERSGGPYTACFWAVAASPELAYAAECKLWHEMGGPEGDLDSAVHPVPPGDVCCPICE